MTELGDDFEPAPAAVEEVARVLWAESRRWEQRHSDIVSVYPYERLIGATKDDLREYATAVLRALWTEIRLGDLITPILSAKLKDMQLHDDTGDPHDEGYMAAVNELREWLVVGDEPD